MALGPDRARLAREALAGYPHGPDAPLVARDAALARASSARSLVLVEGVSDQVAVETLAGRLSFDLARAGAVVLPMGGAHAVASHLYAGLLVGALPLERMPEPLLGVLARAG